MLNGDEARDYLAQPVSEGEREQVLDLVGWFVRRYPTPLARLAYVRRAYARWQRTFTKARELTLM